jgi:hypothetical protein
MPFREGDPTYEVEVRLKKVTEKAYLCRIDGNDHWIPRSQINEDESEVSAEGDVGVLSMSEWIAQEKGLV